MESEYVQLNMFGEYPVKSSDWKWSFKDYPTEKNGLKVFSCFACGGGSTMGYKLAGCDVIGCCEIDPKMNEVYVRNHHPKYNFLMDIRKFNETPNEELPEELFHLDILDGSPPCTTFSMAGDREDSWGKTKKFREGQTEQTLDDLSFVFINTARKLKPKVVVMENVEGLLLGNAWSYVQRIYSEFNEAGYDLRHWLLRAEEMGVPQKRHRSFFVAVRKDLGFDIERIRMHFNYEQITYGEVKSGAEVPAKGKLSEAAKNAKPTESMADAMLRLFGKYSGITHRVCRPNQVFPTLITNHGDLWTENGTHPSIEDMISVQTFPSDFDFGGGYQWVNYICGMSVPPVMTKRVVTKLIESGVFGG